MTRIALIHATRVAMAPIETAAARLWPEAEMISILEEGLSVDRARTAELTDGLTRRILSLSRYAAEAGAEGILFTCSAFGAAIERASTLLRLPVMKPNEAMFEAAFAQGRHVALIYTFPPAAAGMEAEFRAAAQARGSAATITSVYCPGALEAKRAGDGATHDRLIAECAAGIAAAEVILLAQFSMATAAEAARAASRVPVLTSPEAAITELRRRIEAGGGQQPC